MLTLHKIDVLRLHSTDIRHSW